MEQHLPGAGFCETESQLSPITAQLYATSYTWANRNQPEEANGNETGLLLANQDRGVADSNSSGGKQFFFIGQLKEIRFLNYNVLDTFVYLIRRIKSALCILDKSIVLKINFKLFVMTSGQKVQRFKQLFETFGVYLSRLN